MTVALIGVDVGTTGVKAIAIAPDGEVLARVEQSYPLSTPRPGWSEQDPEDWWRASEAALARSPRSRRRRNRPLRTDTGLVVLDAAENYVISRAA